MIMFFNFKRLVIIINWILIAKSRSKNEISTFLGKKLSLILKRTIHWENLRSFFVKNDQKWFWVFPTTSWAKKKHCTKTLNFNFEYLSGFWIVTVLLCKKQRTTQVLWIRYLCYSNENKCLSKNWDQLVKLKCTRLMR